MDVRQILEQAAALAAKVSQVTAAVLAKHIGRADVVRATWLALIAGRPAFFLGPPGVDKTGTVQAMAGRVAGAVFHEELMPTVVSVEQLLVESTSIEEKTTPSGGKSIRTKDTLGRAANAHLFFADEIWKADPRVLQTVLDLAKGDGVRHEGRLVKTPLLAFLAASNELPESEGNLGALWSRMTLRVQVSPLDANGKRSLVQARLRRDRTKGTPDQSVQLSLTDIEILRSARPLVAVSDEIVATVLEIVEGLVNDSAAGFDWLWADDRRFGRLFDVLQANALLDGRTAVTKADLTALEFLLWDTPEQIPAVKAALAPYCRTPLGDARELVQSLLAPGGTVAAVVAGERTKGVQALTQIEAAEKELAVLRQAAGADLAGFDALANEVTAAKAEVIAIVTGAKKGGSAT